MKAELSQRQAVKRAMKSKQNSDLASLKFEAAAANKQIKEFEMHKAKDLASKADEKIKNSDEDCYKIDGKY